jgi:hypothetical protein
MENLLAQYNYDRFIHEKFDQWDNFDAAPKPGTIAQDFPLWQLDHHPVRLLEVLAQNEYTLLEFGSFT